MHAYMQSLPMPEPDRYADVPVAQDAQVLQNPAGS